MVGFDYIRAKLRCYSERGLKFAKWRTVISAGSEIPDEWSIITSAYGLARYAALCQEAGILPIVEPEVQMNGDHGIEQSAQVTKAVLGELFRQLSLQQVHLRCLVLRPNLVISGLRAMVQASPMEVADTTIDCLMETVPWGYLRNCFARRWAVAAGGDGTPKCDAQSGCNGGLDGQSRKCSLRAARAAGAAWAAYTGPARTLSDAA